MRPLRGSRTPPHQDHYLRERNAKLRAQWIYNWLSGAACPDPREPVDALVAEDRLFLKRELARAWLAQRAAEKKAQPAAQTPTARRLCRVLAFHTKRH